MPPWVDDVAIITNNIEDQQTLLSITNTTANKYRIQFGKEKSKLLIIGKDNTNPTIKLGDMSIDPCETYKYLGETLNTKNNINDHIKEIERKTEAALQSALYIAGDDNYQGIEMETIRTLIESCIIPIITYGSETWDINQNQTKRLNRILDNIIKRILNLPQSTPRECLYYELGTLDIEHRIITKRINYATTLLIKNPDNLRDILQTTNPKSWIQKTRQQARSVGLDLETLRHISAKDRKVSVKESTTKTMNDKHDTEGQNKSKFKFLTTNSGTRRSAKPFYLYKLPKEQARAIFMARTRMIKVKTNRCLFSPRTTADYRGLVPLFTVDYRGLPRTTVDYRGLPRTGATFHCGLPRTTADYRGLPWTTPDWCHFSLWTTADYRGLFLPLSQ